MKILTPLGLEKLNSISDKYHFQTTFEITNDNALQFCQDLNIAIFHGLELEDEDMDFFEKTFETLSNGQ